MIDVLLNADLAEAERTGVPDWPARIRPADGPAPPPGWRRMQPGEYAAWRDRHEAAQDAWLAARAGAQSPESAPAIPDAVPRWAALAVMRQTSSAPGMSLYDVVDADVRASGDVVLQSWWEGGSEMRRDSAALAALAARRGLSPAAVDAMFAAAGALAASGL